MKRMLMLMLGVFFVSVSVYGKEISGKKYENILWTFDDEFGNLRIEGIASSPGYIAMPDVPNITKTGEIGFFTYQSGFEAWHPYRHSITNVYISQGVTKIGSYAFWDHRNMKRIDIPNSVYYIDNHAFAGCSNLTSVSVSYWFCQLDSTAFVDCPKLERISVNETNHWFQSIDGVLYGPKEGSISYKYQKKDVLLRCPSARYADGRVYNIPDNAIEIGDYSFMGCSGIGGVNIPDTVRHIGEQAFDGCTGLVHVELPSSVTSVDSYAFKDCANLKSVVLPPSLGSLSSSVFEGCSSLETIFMHADADTQFDAASLPASVSIIRWKIIDDRILVISGRGSVPSWRKCPWSSEIDSIKSVTIGNGITNISEDAFYDCDSLTSVTIGDSVTNIGDEAFYYCSSLTSVAIPDSVTAIGNYAFDGCCSLKSVAIGDSVTNIGSYAFEGCFLLTSVTIPDSVTNIGDGAFVGCNHLMSVTVGRSVTHIGDYAFYCCYNIIEVINRSSLSIVAGSGSNGFLASGAKEVHSGESKIINYNDFSFYTYNGVNYLLGYVGDSNSILLPTNYKGEKYEIYRWAFSGCSSLASITIPNSVTSIGDSAFSYCDGLTSVTIGNSVTSIGDSAFSRCSGLTSVTIPDSVTNIGYSAFYECGSLKSVTIPSNVTSVGHQAFFCCTNVVEVTVPGWKCEIDFSSVTNLIISEGTTSIVEKAFSWCIGLTSVTIPNSVTSIGSNVFKECYNIKDVTVGQYICSNGLDVFPSYQSITNVAIFDGVTSIGDYAFTYCSGLTSITIPDSVKSIGENAFSYCSGLTSFIVDSNNPNFKSVNGLLLSKDGKTLIAGVKGNIVIPDSVTSIGRYAFMGCSGLTSVTIPDSMTSIGDSAFYWCSGLTSVTIGDSVTSIGKWAFKYCDNLKSAIFLGDAPKYVGHDIFCDCADDFTIKVKKGTKGWNGDYTSTALPATWHRYPIAYATEDEVLGIMTELVDGMEWKYRVVNGEAEIYGGDRISAIPETTTGAITIPSSLGCYPVTGIGARAFSWCSGLTSVTIPDSVTSIGDEAFFWCRGLTSITIPDSVTSIGEYAFYSCSGLTSITIPNSVTSIGDCAFSYCSGLTSFIVDSNNPNFKSVNGLLLSKDGKTLIAGINGDVVIPDGVTSIESYAFSECWGLTSVTIPDSVTSIGDEAFYNCSDLTSVTIGNSVTSIGEYAFSECWGLTSVTIPDSVTSIGDSAFSWCSDLTSVTIGNSVTSIGEYAFSECWGLTSVTIPDSVTSIGDSAFSGCSGLTSVMIGNSVTSIGRWAFEYCDNLKSAIFLGDAPKYVGYDIFCDCADVFTIKVKKGTKGWNGDYTSTALPATWHGYPIEYARGDDLYPELDANATAEDVANALSGSVDENLAKNITSVEMYNNYREWALSVKNTSGDEVAGVEAVKASSNAWLSFALDSDVLIANKPVDGDVVIDSFEKDSASGLFEFTVNIKDIGVGGDAIEANLKKIFDIEGAETLASGGAGFSTDNVEVNAATPVNGNVKFIVAPKMGNGEKPDSFFFRVKMK